MPYVLYSYALFVPPEVRTCARTSTGTAEERVSRPLTHGPRSTKPVHSCVPPLGCGSAPALALGRQLKSENTAATEWEIVSAINAAFRQSTADEEDAISPHKIIVKALRVILGTSDRHREIRICNVLYIQATNVKAYVQGTSVKFWSRLRRNPFMLDKRRTPHKLVAELP